MEGCNGFTIDRFTDKEIEDLIEGQEIGHSFVWRGNAMYITSLTPFECHAFWDLTAWHKADIAKANDNDSYSH